MIHHTFLFNDAKFIVGTKPGFVVEVNFTLLWRSENPPGLGLVVVRERVVSVNVL
jgi:hypothetical protein